MGPTAMAYAIDPREPEATIPLAEATAMAVAREDHELTALQVTDTLPSGCSARSPS